MNEPRGLAATPGATVRVYGILIEFDAPETLLQAARTAFAAGFRQMDAYSPHPIEELAENLGQRHDGVAPFALIGGLTGGALGFGMQAYASVVDYPINVGGRPLFSWPAFIPVTFELTILGAALSAAVALFGLSHLPELWHPVFESSRFARASRDRFFLCLESIDPKLAKLREEGDAVATLRDIFQAHRALSVEEVCVED